MSGRHKAGDERSRRDCPEGPVARRPDRAYDATVRRDRGGRRQRRRSATSRSSRWPGWATPSGRWRKFAEYGLDGSSNVARAHDRRAHAEGPRAQHAGRAGAAGGDGAGLRTPITTSTRRRSDSFPGINAATLALLGRATTRSRGRWREAVLADPAVAAPADYYKAATRAEALLLLGRTDEVTETAGERRGARQRRSWRPLLDPAPARHGRRAISAWATRSARPWSRRSRPPRVLHYCGPYVRRRAARTRRGSAPRVDAVLDEEEIGFAYGALACGGDIIAAEALLDRGASSSTSSCRSRSEDFLAQSVLPGGAGLGGALPRLPRGARSASSTPARWPISAIPTNMAMPAAWRWGWRGCAPSISPPEPVQLAIWDGQASGRAGRDRRRRARLAGGGRADADRRPGRGQARPRPAAAADRHRRRARAGGDPVHRFRGLLEARRDGAAGLLGRGDAASIADVLDAHGRRGGVAQLLGRRALRR